MLEEPGRREAQGVRVCAGLILLFITVMLTRMQDIPDGPSSDRSRKQRPSSRSSWIHSSPICATSVARLAYFESFPSPTLSWQYNIPLERENLQHAMVMNALEDVKGLYGSWSALKAFNESGPLNDESLFTSGGGKRAKMSRILKVVPMYGSDEACQHTGNTSSSVCFAALQSLSERDCDKALWWESLLQKNNELQSKKLYRCWNRKQQSCVRMIFANSLVEIHEKSLQIPSSRDSEEDRTIGCPMCGVFAHTTLTYDQSKNELLLVGKETTGLNRNQTSSNWVLYTMAPDPKLNGTSWALKPNVVYIPEIDITKLKTSIVPFLVRNRLGQSHQKQEYDQVFVQSNKLAKNNEIDALSNSSTSSTTMPFLNFVTKSGRYMAVIHSEDESLIVKIFQRDEGIGEFRLTQSVLFDSFDSGWIIDAADSEAGDFLLLMGSSPPYSWRVEAIDLQTGTVDTRHSFLSLR